MLSRLEFTVSMFLVFTIVAVLAFVSLRITRFTAGLIYQIFFKG